jgi:hypothetical protein
MGTIIYDFLTESMLFDDTNIENKYSSISDSVLRRELSRYREHVLSNHDELLSEIISKNSSLKIFGEKDYFSIQNLMQTALYFDQVVLPDPIFPFTEEDSDVSDNLKNLIGFSSDRCINKHRLLEAVIKMKSLKPMIAANYLKYFPITYYNETGKNIPITYSSTGYSDVIAKPILDKYKRAAIVRSTKIIGGNMVVEDSLSIGRGISIQFNGDNPEKGYFYNLFDREAIVETDQDGVFNFMLSSPEVLPDQAYFDAWVNQSINQSSISHYNEMCKGLIMSSRLGASYLTGSEFAHGLLDTNTQGQNIDTYTGNCVLNIELPFLENISIENLMGVRQDDGEAFAIFRADLQSKFKELRIEKDPEVIKKKVQNIIHYYNGDQLVKINQKVKDLKKGFFANVAVAVALLGGNVVTSGFTVAGAVLALANGYRVYADYRGKIMENPAYFLWKIKHRK